MGSNNNLKSLGLPQTFSKRDVNNMVEMSNAANIYILYDRGTAAAKEVQKSHF